MRRQTTLRIYYIVKQEATKHDAELELLLTIWTGKLQALLYL